MYKLIVWTRVRAEPEVVRDLVADPSEVGLLLPPWVRWELSDPEGLRRARLAGRPGTWAGRVRVGAAVVSWPVEVVDGDGRWRFTERSSSALFSTWVHRHRLERAIGGRVRYVDELVIEPTRWPGRLWVAGVERALRRVHEGLAARVALDADVRTASRVYRLEAGNAAHAEAALGELPGG